ncbi:hypothetical protein CB1_001515004 [Camelus ferus]|nr:hypothetical protein CB1_001515004 [Camelus ferus]
MRRGRVPGSDTRLSSEGLRDLTRNPNPSASAQGGVGASAEAPEVCVPLSGRCSLARLRRRNSLRGDRGLCPAVRRNFLQRSWLFLQEARVGGNDRWAPHCCGPGHWLPKLDVISLPEQEVELWTVDKGVPQGVCPGEMQALQMPGWTLKLSLDTVKRPLERDKEGGILWKAMEVTRTRPGHSSHCLEGPGGLRGCAMQTARGTAANVHTGLWIFAGPSRPTW